MHTWKATVKYSFNWPNGTVIDQINIGSIWLGQCIDIALFVSFSISDKKTKDGHVSIGFYANGFKSSSMRLGKDAIVFSKKGESMCVGMLSQMYLKEINAENIIVPIVTFKRNGGSNILICCKIVLAIADFLHVLFYILDLMILDLFFHSVLSQSMKQVSRTSWDTLCFRWKKSCMQSSRLSIHMIPNTPQEHE